MAQIARIECQFGLEGGSHFTPQFTEFETVVLEPLQFYSVMKDNPLCSHAENNIQCSSVRRQGRRQADGFSAPFLCRQFLNAPMRGLQVYVDDPFVKDLAEGAEQNDSVLGGVVIVALQDAGECCTGHAMHEIAVHGCLEALKRPLVPWHQHLCILDICADLQAGMLKMRRMELRRIIDDYQLRKAVALPLILDRGKVA